LNKRQTAELYKDFFAQFSDIRFITEPTDSRSNYWLQAVQLKDKDAQQAFLEFTNSNGVMTRPIWELMNRLPMFADCQTDELVNTKHFADTIVNIPSGVIMR
jgi:dTDP-4-amino-4,6-dideoxygalactose transaminase